MRKPNLINTLYPLPDSDTTPSKFINAIVQWIAVSDDPSHRAFIKWLCQEYSVNVTMAQNYANIALRLLLWTRVNGDGICLTELGKTFIRAAEPEKHRALIWQFLQRCIGASEMLTIYAQTERQLLVAQVTLAMQRTVSELSDPEQIRLRIQWFESLGCLETVHSDMAQITQLGHDAIAAYRSEPDSSIGQLFAGVNSRGHLEFGALDEELKALIYELTVATTDSRSPRRLELAVTNAFTYLGFHTTHLGKPGEGDVLIRADCGSRSYNVVGDAKSRQDGKLEELAVYTLNEHRKQENAQYALVMAGSFADGRTVRSAQDSKIALMPVTVLIAWLRFHAKTPLNLTDYEVMFSTPGLVTELSVVLKAAAELKQRWVRLLVKLIETMQVSHRRGLTDALNSAQIRAMLVMHEQGMAYSEDEIQQALALLAYPAIGGAITDSNGCVDLVVSKQMLSQIFRAVANQLDGDNWSDID